MTDYAKTLFEALQDKRKTYTGYLESYRSLLEWEKEAYEHAFEVALAEYDKTHYRELAVSLDEADATCDALRDELRVANARIAELEKVPVCSP